MRAANILETIGSTPHIRINRLFGDAEVWVKSERANPGGSIKDNDVIAAADERVARAPAERREWNDGEHLRRRRFLRGGHARQSAGR